jgi:hypothetical protein
MAHEVGHLVLPVYSHSDEGLMRAHIGVRSTSGRNFTTEQAAAIRSMLLAESRPHAADVTDAAVVGVEVSQVSHSVNLCPPTHGAIHE